MIAIQLQTLVVAPFGPAVIVEVAVDVAQMPHRVCELQRRVHRSQDRDGFLVCRDSGSISMKRSFNLAQLSERAA